MSPRFVVRPKAERELDQLAIYFATERSVELGDRFLMAADQTFELLAANPNIGWHAQARHRKLKGLRVFRIDDFEKILILYRPLPKGVEILRVVHGARNLQAMFRRRGEFE